MVRRLARVRRRVAAPAAPLRHGAGPPIAAHGRRAARAGARRRRRRDGAGRSPGTTISSTARCCAFALPRAPILGGELAVYPGAFFTRGRAGVARASRRAPRASSASSTSNAGRARRRASHPGLGLLDVRAWEGAVLPRRDLARRRARGPQLHRRSRPASPRRDVLVRHGYLGPRLGLGAEFEASPRALQRSRRRAGAARWISTGDLSSAAWFPHTRAWGVDVGHLRSSWAARCRDGPRQCPPEWLRAGSRPTWTSPGRATSPPSGPSPAKRASRAGSPTTGSQHARTRMVAFVDVGSCRADPLIRSA